VRVLRSYSLYGAYRLDALREGGAGGDSDAILGADGTNLFVVLRNLKAAPRRFGDRFSWVLAELRRAFPGMIDDLEFDPPVGNLVPARFFSEHSKTAPPMSRAADGLLVGLLHLTAVASAEDGGVLAIDELENQLHPHAIRSLLKGMRERAEDRGLTILLTTHSPVLMNEFREAPSQFYVMEPGQGSLPVSLATLHDPDWLAHFSLGDLYDRLEFASPLVGRQA
jgi:predicted ATPase